MKKLAILASVVMIFTAPIMAQTAAKAAPEESRVRGTATVYGSGAYPEDSIKREQKGIEGLSTELAPAPAATDLFLESDPAHTVGLEAPEDSLSGLTENSQQRDLGGTGADFYRGREKTSIDADPFFYRGREKTSIDADPFSNQPPSSVPNIK
jgi:hypothetical protein